MFYSTFTILLASIHVIMIYSQTEVAIAWEMICTQRGHFDSTLELRGTD